MSQFLCKRLKGSLHSVEVFEDSENIEAAVALDLARIEGMDAEIFVGTDLRDVVTSHEGYFAEAGRP